ncbi:hypothetical protein J6590_038989 [Homalodisca vitripennis]|nr:hypothetical protein J6590_038989 [Homalodisca vitripennis]
MGQVTIDNLQVFSPTHGDVLLCERIVTCLAKATRKHLQSLRTAIESWRQKRMGARKEILPTERNKEVMEEIVEVEEENTH